MATPIMDGPRMATGLSQTECCRIVFTRCRARGNRIATAKTMHHAIIEPAISAKIRIENVLPKDDAVYQLEMRSAWATDWTKRIPYGTRNQTQTGRNRPTIDS